MLTLYRNASSAAASYDLIVIKAIMILEAFMKFAWSVVSLFIAITTNKTVSMTVILAAFAAAALFFHINHEIHFDIDYTKSVYDFIEMIDISDNNKSYKRPSPPASDNEPVEPLKPITFPSVPSKASFVI